MNQPNNNKYNPNSDNNNPYSNYSNPYNNHYNPCSNNRNPPAYSQSPPAYSQNPSANSSQASQYGSTVSPDQLAKIRKEVEVSKAQLARLRETDSEMHDRIRKETLEARATLESIRKR